MVPSSAELLTVSEHLVEQLSRMQKDAEERTRQIGWPHGDNIYLVDMSFTCEDDTSKTEDSSSGYRRYRPSDLDGFEESYPVVEIEKEIEVDISTAARAVIETLDGSDDENYTSCNEETFDLVQVNCQEESGRIYPRDFIPVPSAEFGQICQIIIDGTLLRDALKTIFFL